MLTSPTWFHCLQNPVHAVTPNELTFPRNTLFCSFVFLFPLFPSEGFGSIYACIRCHRESWPVHFPGNASHALRRFLSSCLEFFVFQMVRPGSVSGASHLLMPIFFFLFFFGPGSVQKRKDINLLPMRNKPKFSKKKCSFSCSDPGLHCLS